jgi:hypothetical protein
MLNPAMASALIKTATPTANVKSQRLFFLMRAGDWSAAFSI